MTTRPFDALYVAWRAETGHILPVARLVRIVEGAVVEYEFAYVKGAEAAARQHSFEPFITFPKLDELYRSRDLSPFFGNRVMPRSRPDFADFVNELGLSVEEADPMRILARSNGRRNTDHVELFAPPIVTSEGLYETHMHVRGIRHYPGSEEAIAELSGGAQLLPMADPQNEVNPKAIALRTTSGVFLGFVPNYLCEDLDALDALNVSRSMSISVERINRPPAPVHRRLLCRLTVVAPAGFQPLASETFDPIPSGARELRTAA